MPTQHPPARPLYPRLHGGGALTGAPGSSQVLAGSPATCGAATICTHPGSDACAVRGRARQRSLRRKRSGRMTVRRALGLPRPAIASGISLCNCGSSRTTTLTNECVSAHGSASDTTRRGPMGSGRWGKRGLGRPEWLARLPSPARAASRDTRDISIHYHSALKHVLEALSQSRLVCVIANRSGVMSASGDHERAVSV